MTDTTTTTARTEADREKYGRVAYYATFDSIHDEEWGNTHESIREEWRLAAESAIRAYLADHAPPGVPRPGACAAGELYRFTDSYGDTLTVHDATTCLVLAIGDDAAVSIPLAGWPAFVRAIAPPGSAVLADPAAGERRPATPAERAAMGLADLGPGPDGTCRCCGGTGYADPAAEAERDYGRIVYHELPIRPLDMSRLNVPWADASEWLRAQCTRIGDNVARAVLTDPAAGERATFDPADVAILVHFAEREGPTGHLTVDQAISSLSAQLRAHGPDFRRPKYLAARAPAARAERLRITVIQMRRALRTHGLLTDRMIEQIGVLREGDLLDAVVEDEKR